MRVVFDTNTIISGTLWSGNPRRVLDAARDEVFDLFTTQELINELIDVLGRDKFAARMREAGLSVAQVVDNFAAIATIVESESISPIVLRDPDDDAVIACAITSHSDVIVSGDSDLLDLEGYLGIRIITPTELVAELKI